MISFAENASLWFTVSWRKVLGSNSNAIDNPIVFVGGVDSYEGVFSCARTLPEMLCHCAFARISIFDTFDVHQRATLFLCHCTGIVRSRPFHCEGSLPLPRMYFVKSIRTKCRITEKQLRVDGKRRIRIRLDLERAIKRKTKHWEIAWTLGFSRRNFIYTTIWNRAV